MSNLKKIDEVRKIFSDAGCVLLSNEYVNCRTPLNFIGTCGHKISATLMSFNCGHNRMCPSCRKNSMIEIGRKFSGKGYTFEEIKSILESRGLTILSTSYSPGDKIRYIGKCGHECNRIISQICNIGGDICTDCKRKIMSKNSRKSIEEIEREFSDRGCKYLSGYETAYSDVEYIASCGHKNVCTLHNFLRGQSTICSDCANKRWQGEEFLYNILKDIFAGFKIIRQYRIYKNGSCHPLKFDFYLPDKNLIIEYNGEQHYKKSRWFNSSDVAFERYKENDEFKKEWCNKNGIDFVVIDGRKHTYKNLSVDVIKKELSKWI